MNKLIVPCVCAILACILLDMVKLSILILCYSQRVQPITQKLTIFDEVIIPNTFRCIHSCVSDNYTCIILQKSYETQEESLLQDETIRSQLDAFESAWCHYFFAKQVVVRDTQEVLLKGLR